MKIKGYILYISLFLFKGGIFMSNLTVNKLQGAVVPQKVDKIKEKDNKGEKENKIEMDKMDNGKKLGVSNRYDSIDIDKLQKSVEDRLSSLRETVKAMIEKQGYHFNDSKISSGKEKLESDSEKLEIDSEVSEKAKSEISEDGYWGVKQTSERIIEFAKNISGGDTSKLEVLKGAIKDGFEAAKKAFGGKLPEISQKTYDAVMEGLDNWAKEED